MTEKPNVLELSEADLRAYAVRHGDELVKVLNRMKESGRPSAMSWSWLGFFLPLSWFAYRRMWGWLVGMIGVFAGLTMIQNATGLDFGGGPAVGIAAAVGIMGKQLVIQRAARAVAEADAKGLRGSHRAEFLAESGGVNVTAAWIVGIATFGLIGLAVLSATTRV
ncbi:MAG: DUF2628 domain-containing protein [Alphaproteobacteria bacterium]